VTRDKVVFYSDQAVHPCFITAGYLPRHPAYKDICANWGYLHVVASAHGLITRPPCAGYAEEVAGDLAYMLTLKSATLYGAQ
jgi:hypothetical protein